MRKYYVCVWEKSEKYYGPYETLNDARAKAIRWIKKNPKKKFIPSITTSNSKNSPIFGYVLDYRKEYGFFGWTTVNQRSWHRLKEDGSTTGFSW